MFLNTILMLYFQKSKHIRESYQKVLTLNAQNPGVVTHCHEPGANTTSWDQHSSSLSCHVRPKTIFPLLILQNGYFKSFVSKGIFFDLFFPSALEMSLLSFVAQISCIAGLEPIIPSKDINIFFKFTKSPRHHKLGYTIERLPILQEHT